MQVDRLGLHLGDGGVLAHLAPENIDRQPGGARRPERFGDIETEMTQAIPPQLRAAEVARIPAGRVGAPQDIAGTVLFLASPAADFITGQVISVNGGQLMP